MEFYLSFDELLGKTASPVILIFFPIFLITTVVEALLIWRRPGASGCALRSRPLRAGSSRYWHCESAVAAGERRVTCESNPRLLPKRAAGGCKQARTAPLDNRQHVFSLCSLGPENLLETHYG